MPNTEIDIEELKASQATWNEFLEAWPFERVKTMTLEEYSNPGGNNSFSYWIEFGTTNLGSIKGGDSSKFGIYRRKNEPKGERSHIIHGGEYSWKKNLGNSEEEVFQRIKSQLIEVIVAVKSGDLDVIQQSPLPNTIKWKTAFLYQDQSAPSVLAIFKEAVFQRACRSSTVTVAQANRELMSKKPDNVDAASYSYHVWYSNQPPKNEIIEQLKEHLTLDILEGMNNEKLELLHKLTELANELSLDIYPTAKSDQLKIGRQEKPIQDKATASFAIINFSKRNIKIAIGERRENLTLALMEDLEQMMSEFSEDNPTERLGYWPSDYGQEELSLKTESGEVERMDSIANELLLPMNQILYGPPGTGKTYHLQQIEKTYISDTPHDEPLNRRYSMTTFHQSYGYEEFIEGIKAETDENGNISYSVSPGVFLKLCQRAEKDPNHRYAIFIDEINRGNISKIFGELISLIELDKRSGCDNAMSIKLTYSGKEFSVPANVDIIGTMNTADRSLAMMDTALRRRFDFVEMMPKPELLEGCDVKGINLERLLIVLNQRIEILYDREHMLGHAFFMPVKKTLEEQGEEQAFEALELVFKNKIIPLLEEYFFEDWEKIRLVLADNQKTNQPDLQFVKRVELKNTDLNSLFGSNHQLDQYGQTQVRYTLAKPEAAIWSTPNSYLGVYSAGETDTHTQVNDSDAVSNQ
ncbi:McrB family protein [Vibrio genomosp. F10]|uniref:McrB family protein n=1 Tax=Vibrio genomosp. F10 TaxID=723171 RepID=UPI00031DF9E8|nr:AAA family ATPase [Vibrio genomosp. F10]